MKQRSAGFFFPSSVRRDSARPQRSRMLGSESAWRCQRLKSHGVNLQRSLTTVASNLVFAAPIDRTMAHAKTDSTIKMRRTIDL
jgi:hypothetical protein